MNTQRDGTAFPGQSRKTLQKTTAGQRIAFDLKAQRAFELLQLLENGYVVLVAFLRWTAVMTESSGVEAKPLQIREGCHNGIRGAEGNRSAPRHQAMRFVRSSAEGAFVRTPPSDYDGESRALAENSSLQ